MPWPICLPSPSGPCARHPSWCWESPAETGSIGSIRPTTTRIVGVDVNPSYLEAVRRRYAGLPGLELYCVDLAHEAVDLEPAQLVHAALVFEHAGTGRCLENAVSLVSWHGALSVVLQMPGEWVEDVSPSPFLSMQALKPCLSLIDPRWLMRLAGRSRFRTAQSIPSRSAGRQVLLDGRIRTVAF